MFTSRAEFRLHLRIDNADRRLTPHGRRVGLISDEAWADFQAKQERLERLKKLLESTRLTPKCCGTYSSACHSEERSDEEPAVAGSARQPSMARPPARRCAQLLKRPEITIEQLVPVLRELAPRVLRTRNESVSSASSVAELSSEVRNELKSVETEIKYEGYLLQQQRAMERLKKSEQHSIPDWFDYRSVSGLSREMQEKLTQVQPAHARPSLAHSRSDAGGGVAGECLTSKFRPAAASRPPRSRRRFYAANSASFCSSSASFIRSPLLLSSPYRDKPGPADDGSSDCSGPWWPRAAGRAPPVRTRLFSRAPFPSGCNGPVEVASSQMERCSSRWASSYFCTRE